MKKIIFYLLVVGLFCSLRCKEGPDEPKPIKPYDQRDQFVGVYSVVSDSGNVYQIQITKVDSADKKYIRILNYGNLFSQLLSDYSATYLPLNYFSIGGGGFGVKDKYNRSWDLSQYNDDTTTLERENVLENNRIILYYRLQNMPWWSVEGVPYHFAFHKHVATKIY